MIENLPISISFIFFLITILTLSLFVFVIRKSNSVIIRDKTFAITSGLILWLIIQATLSITNVYNTDVSSIPPKIIVLGILPNMLLIVVLFTTQKGLNFIDSLPLKQITYINIVRIPVEITLYLLFINKAIPQLMTFEGRNFDILAGITAPLIIYFGLKKRLIGEKTILIWNILCFVLLINIVINAFLSAPSPLQKFAFNQPNIAILNFPFSWLPTFIVPIVLFGHLVSVRRLMKFNLNHNNL